MTGGESKPSTSKPALVVERRIRRPPQDRHLALASPDRRGIQQLAGDLLVVDRLEEAEERGLLPVEGIVVAVQDRRNPPDVAVAPARNEELHLAVTEERVFILEDLRHVRPQRGDPVRVSGVDRLGDVEESGEVGATASDALDHDRRGRVGQRLSQLAARPIRRPSAPARPRDRPSRTRRAPGPDSRGYAWPSGTCGSAPGPAESPARARS